MQQEQNEHEGRVNEEEANETQQVDQAEEQAEAEEQAMWDAMAKDKGGEKQPEPQAADDSADADDDDAPQEAASGDESKPAEGKTEDPWASLPDWAREEREKLLNSKRSAEGRYVAAQRELDKLRQDAKAAPAGKARQQAEDRVSLAKKKLAAIRDDYPEIAGPLTDAFEALGGDLQELKAAEESRRKAAQEQHAAFIREQANKINELHPDWTTVVSKNEAAFRIWLDDQPAAIRKAAELNWKDVVDAQALAQVISGFKQHLGLVPGKPPQNSRRDRQLAGSASPTRSSPRPTVSGIPLEGDEDRMWEAMVKERERTMRLR